MATKHFQNHKGYNSRYAVKKASRQDDGKIREVGTCNCCNKLLFIIFTPEVKNVEQRIICEGCNHTNVIEL